MKPCSAWTQTTEENIRHLSDMEHVRTRPGMYIGRLGDGSQAEDGSPMKKSEKQWLDAVEQIRRYADAPRVEALRQGTTLHKIIMQFKGWELARIEEIE